MLTRSIARWIFTFNGPHNRFKPTLRTHTLGTDKPRKGNPFGMGPVRSPYQYRFINGGEHLEVVVGISQRHRPE